MHCRCIEICSMQRQYDFDRLESIAQFSSRGKKPNEETEIGREKEIGRRRGKGLGIWFGGVSGRNFRVAQDCFPYTTWSTVLILLSFLPGTI